MSMNTGTNNTNKQTGRLVNSTFPRSILAGLSFYEGNGKMETKFTQGKWKIGHDGHQVRTVDESHKKGGLVIAQIYGTGIDDVNANARLIAASPELYAACKALQPLAIKHAPHGIDEEYWNFCFEMLERAIYRVEVDCSDIESEDYE